MKPTLSIDSTTWTIMQAHQQQTEIGWRSFTNGILSEKWAQIQQQHYTRNPKDGENTFRWKHELVRTILDLIKELWYIRCGFINAERMLTERDMLSIRALQTFNEYKQRREMIPVIDRHLLEKEAS